VIFEGVCSLSVPSALLAHPSGRQRVEGGDLAKQTPDQSATPKRWPPYSTRPKRSVHEREVKLLTDEEVADQLACTAKRARTLFYDGDLPGVYVGGLLRFEQAEVDAFIKRHRATGARSKARPQPTIRKRSSRRRDV
jgi:excisionase family DNA binding protein